MKRFVFLCALCVSSAFAGILDTPAFTDSDYGPLPANYSELAASYIRPRLKDPESARFRVVREPAKIAWAYGTGANLKYLPTWSVTVAVNAKNSFGGYVGEKLYVVYLHRGEAVGSLDL